MSDKDIVEEARELLANATPGPWRTSRTDRLYVLRDSDDKPTVARATGLTRDEGAANAALIARAPELLRVLADEAERLRAENKDVKTCDYCERKAVNYSCDKHFT